MAGKAGVLSLVARSFQGPTATDLHMVLWAQLLQGPKSFEGEEFQLRPDFRLQRTDGPKSI